MHFLAVGLDNLAVFLKVCPIGANISEGCNGASAAADCQFLQEFTDTVQEHNKYCFGMFSDTECAD